VKAIVEGQLAISSRVGVNQKDPSFQNDCRHRRCGDWSEGHTHHSISLPEVICRHCSGLLEGAKPQSADWFALPQRRWYVIRGCETDK